MYRLEISCAPETPSKLARGVSVTSPGCCQRSSTSRNWLSRYQPPASLKIRMALKTSLPWLKVRKPVRSKPFQVKVLVRPPV